MEKKFTSREIVGISVIVLLSVALVVLSTFLGIYSSDKIKYKTSVENVYRHAYYSLTDNLTNIETSLAKMRVTYGTHMAEEVLESVTANASLATVALSTLNTDSNDLANIFKFTNQVGDYAKYLTTKVQKGEDIEENERDILSKMHDIAVKIGDALADVEERVNRDGYSFVDSLGKENDSFSLAIRDLNNGSIKYPALIYDGPFSDGIHDRAPKHLTGEARTHEQCEENIRELFPAIESITYSGENTNKFTSFVYDVTINDGHTGTIQVSKIGGHILMFTSFIEEVDDVITEEQAVEKGTEFLTRAGYENMKNVYISLSHGMYYLNYCPEVDGVLYYPDLVKVKVSAYDGAVVGMEGLNYIYNHTTRTLQLEDVMTETDAIARLDGELDISSVRLALIPKGVEKEVLTYEVIGTIDDSRYYIYLDAVTGDEVNVLMEIDGGGGHLLI